MLARLVAAVFVATGAVSLSCAPSPFAPPECADGSDNDGDGLIDLSDPGCGGDPASDSERGGASSCPTGMVLVPAGPFIMGSDLGEGEPDEEPEHTVNLPAFCIDVTEVTNARYLECEAAGRCPPPQNLDSPTRPDGYHRAAPYGNYPVTYVDWDDARKYCEWRQGRLPTEAEWEKAARGGCESVAPTSCGPEDERNYPWSDSPPTCELANYLNCLGGGAGDTAQVGSRPAGDSPYGLHDMAGNVTEWVADRYGERYYMECALTDCTNPTGPRTGQDHIQRGGGWDDRTNPRVAERRPWPDNDDTHYEDVGFRCASNPN